jgi:hypothetical protein
MSPLADVTWVVLEGASWFVRRFYVPERPQPITKEEKQIETSCRDLLRELPHVDQREVVEDLALEMSTIIGGPYATLEGVAACPHLLDEQCALVLRTARQKAIPHRLDVSLRHRAPREAPTVETACGASPATCHDIRRIVPIPPVEGEESS